MGWLRKENDGINQHIVKLWIFSKAKKTIFWNKATKKERNGSHSDRHILTDTDIKGLLQVFLRAEYVSKSLTIFISIVCG